jgi:hypothetical protein
VVYAQRKSADASLVDEEADETKWSDQFTDIVECILSIKGREGGAPQKRWWRHNPPGTIV